LPLSELTITLRAREVAPRMARHDPCLTGEVVVQLGQAVIFETMNSGSVTAKVQLATSLVTASVCLILKISTS